MAVPTDDTKISMAVREKVATVTELPIAWPREDFEPTGPYLMVGEVKGEPERLTIGGRHRHPYSLMMQMMVPIKDKGTSLVTDEAAALIAAQFQTDERLEFQGMSVRVTQRPHVMEGFREGAWWQTPIRVRFEAFT